MKQIKLIVTVLLILILASNFCGTTIGKKPLDLKIKTTYNQIFLYAKDPITWEINRSGGWGKLKYLTNGTEFEYSLFARRLDPMQIYMLIYYPDPWPGYGLRIIAIGQPEPDGVLRINGSADIGDIPAIYDENYPDGGKIWLVLLNDVGRDSMWQWNPTEYLFENELITFEDTND